MQSQEIIQRRTQKTRNSLSCHLAFLWRQRAPAGKPLALFTHSLPWKPGHGRFTPLWNSSWGGQGSPCCVQALIFWHAGAGVNKCGKTSRSFTAAIWQRNFAGQCQFPYSSKVLQYHDYSVALRGHVCRTIHNASFYHKTELSVYICLDRFLKARDLLIQHSVVF